jgi:hypothetical protein
MKPLNWKRAVGLFAVGVLTLWGVGSPSVRAETPAVDPAAVQILKRMTDYLGALKQFSVNTQNTIEDLTDSGHRVDYDVSAIVAVSRPNKLKAQRMGGLIDQAFYYNGKTLTLYNASDKVYATEPAPGTIEGMLGFARSSLGLVIPAADLIYRNNFKLLMQDVNLAVVVGKESINGVQCDHLLFSRPGVDFQVCVAESGDPLPYKYVVTDTETCALVSISTVMSDWNTMPEVKNASFDFVPPKGVKKISFMPLEVESKKGR